MPEQEVKNVEVPEEWLRWGLGGVATTAAAGAVAIGKWFRGDVRALEARTERTFADVRGEIHALGGRTDQQFDDVWDVINAEREAASRARERNFQRLEQTPTRDEMNGGFARLEKLIRGDGK